VYVDLQREFYVVLGNKSFFGETPLTTWNPFRLYSDFKQVGKRMGEKKIASNMAGATATAGSVKGGVLVVHPTKGIVFSYSEQSSLNKGHTLPPFDEIKAAIDAATSDE
jgi:hypothetical protein